MNICLKSSNMTLQQMPLISTCMQLINFFFELFYLAVIFRKRYMSQENQFTPQFIY